MITGALLVLTDWRVGQLLLAGSSVLFCITGLILRRVAPTRNRWRSWMLILVVLSGAMAVSSLVFAVLPAPA